MAILGIVAAGVLAFQALHSSTGEMPVAAPSVQPSEGPAVAPAIPPAVAPSDVTATLALLATLPIKGKAPMTGYDRTADFGSAWRDMDHNGCDTRDDVLARDLADIVRNGACRVTSGVLVSSYTGQSIHFVRGVTTSGAVQIDHLVALGNAWQTGAQQLSTQQRTLLANDPQNLLAVDGRSNEQKGDGDAATWLPAQKSFRCSYVSHQVTVKSTYRLWLTAAEHDAIVRVLSACHS